ncbi:MAG: aminotransferase class I/II-fold pyridoxal phosphate-dependent enzyme, partial [Actinobacteria bacterium]|nr:aminotransferase class I/II-fold pyridoxal phosphate-dependent enzyme [Actinomycetota bacterium]
VPVFSDECYVEFTWARQPETILQHSIEGVVVLHSLSKRSNLAGLRVGFYAGDEEIVNYLKEVRKHVGMLVPGPAQSAAVVALNDDAHVAVQRNVYKNRLEKMASVLTKWSGSDGWAFAERLAREGGALVSPGDFYGSGGANNVRVAVVQPDDRIALVAERLGRNK